MTDATSLRIEAVSHGPILYLRLYGPIDESFDVDEILSSGSGKDLIINTAAVHRISSFGVREWVNGMAKLALLKSRIVLVECSPVLVKQLNMVSNFAEHCDVASIRAPYFCSACNWDTEVSLEVTAGGVTARAEPVICQRCKAHMELDEDPGFYFRFARPNRFRALDPHVAQFLSSYVRAGHLGKGSATARPTGEPSEGAGKPGTRDRTRRSLPMSWLVAAAAGLVLVVLTAILFSGSGGGVSSEALQRYHRHLSQRDFAGAEKLVMELEAAGDIPVVLAATMRQEITDKRDTERDQALAEGRRQFARKKYDIALESYRQAEKIGGSSPSINFNIAECHRKLGQGLEAADFYGRVIEELGDNNDDKRLDDALFWAADYLAKAGETTEARSLLERIVNDMPKSNFKRSASRALETLE